MLNMGQITNLGSLLAHEFRLLIFLAISVGHKFHGSLFAGARNMTRIPWLDFGLTSNKILKHVHWRFKIIIKNHKILWKIGSVLSTALNRSLYWHASNRYMQNLDIILFCVSCCDCQHLNRPQVRHLFAQCTLSHIGLLQTSMACYL